MHRIHFHNGFYLFLVGAAFLACQKKVAPGRAETCVFTLETSGLTRSLLPDDIEALYSGVSVGVYADGQLAHQAYFPNSLPIFTLEPGKTYRLCAIANMGEVSFPALETGLSDLEVRLESYDFIEEKGLPMAGELTYTPKVSTNTTIPVVRLLSKVTASLSCNWTGSRIREARIYNMNAVLKPFGSSAASGPSDILPFHELHQATGEGSSTLEAVFYVPENLQGSIGAITASANKAPDRDATAAAKAQRLTYLEVEVETEGKYEGTILYRSYLGDNATSNFDICRNSCYHWTVLYRSSLLDDFEDDWKHDYGGLEVISYSLSLSPATNTILSGGTFDYEVRLGRHVLEPIASLTSSPISGTLCRWESGNPAIATVDDGGRVHGVSPGTVSISAWYTPPGPDFTEIMATAYVTVATWNDDWEDDGETVLN